MSQYTFPDSGIVEPVDYLPDPFLRADGSCVTDPVDWPEQREYLKQMLAHYFYGTQPEIPRLHREMHLPFDLHTAKALVASRALISSVEGLSDDWANPYSTQDTWRAADEVFQFLGAYGKNSLHFRTGPHDYNAYDVTAILDFCDALFFCNPFSRDLIRTPTPKEQQVSYCAYPANSPEAAFLRDHIEIRYQRNRVDWSQP